VTTTLTVLHILLPASHTHCQFIKISLCLLYFCSNLFHKVWWSQWYTEKCRRLWWLKVQDNNEGRSYL